MLIALALVNAVEPGVRNGEPVRHMLALYAPTRREGTQGVMSRADTSVLDSHPRRRAGQYRAGSRQHENAGHSCCSSILFGFFLARIPQPQQGTVYVFLAGHLLSS